MKIYPTLRAFFFICIQIVGNFLNASNVHVDPQREDTNLQNEQTRDLQFEEDKNLEQERTRGIQFEEDQFLQQEQTRDLQFEEDKFLQQEKELERM